MKRIFIIPLILFLFFHCEQNPVSNPEFDNSQGTVTFSMDMSDAPDEVSALKGVLSRRGFDSINFDFEILNDEAVAVIKDLISGNWKLSVSAMNDSGVVLYFGETSVNVVPGVETPVYLHLDPTTGSLKIIVTWGDIPGLNQPMLLMAQNEMDEWRILGMNINGSRVRDITAGAYPIWINNRNKFLYRITTQTLAEFDLISNEYQIVGTTPYIVNFLRYSKYMDRIVCDYKENDNWHIAHMKLDGSDFTKVIVNDSWKKRPAPLTMTDWIYYQGNSSGTIQLYRIKFDGQNNEQITFFDNEAEASFPSFNKTGTKLLYSAKGNNFFYIIERDLKSKEERYIDFSDYGEVIYPSYTADEKYIIFILVIGPTYQDREIYRMNPDGSEKVNITPEGGYYHFARPVMW